MEINTLFRLAVDRKASDLHLMGGEVPRIRVSGSLVELDTPAITTVELREMLKQTAPKDFEAKLDHAKAVEWTSIQENLTFSGIAHRSQGDGLAVTFRIFSNEVPSLEKLGTGLEPVSERILSARRGLAIFAGETGSGKWTIVSSLIAAFNEAHTSRIFVVVSSANYVYKKGRGLVTQLFVGQDCETYGDALNIAHASDLDVIAIDDVPNQEVLRQALLLAEVGHLVIVNLHASDPVSAIENLVEGAGMEATSLLRSLAKNLIVVASQRLVQRIDAPGRVALFQWIANGPSIQDALVAGNFEKLKTLQTEDPDCRDEQQSWQYLIEGGYVAPIN